MRLADFILSNVEPILVEWEAFARGIGPAAKLGPLALRDHAAEILMATAADMRSAQTAAQRAAKSHGHRAGGEPAGAALNGASESHALGRLGDGFDLMEMVSEYRALRASVLRLWGESHPGPAERDVDDVTRFNESIDQSITKAVASYTRRVDQSRDLFLAILGHDLRNPLNSIAVSAQMLPHLRGVGGGGGPDAAAADEADEAEAAGLTAQIAINTQVMASMISDLLDYTRTRLGAGMPVTPIPMDLGALCRELLHEFRTAHPDREFRFSAEGDLCGEWDADRLRQAVSNVMGNAVQHGAAGAAIGLRLAGGPSDVVVVVHNGGPPIPPGELPRIFDPLVRGSGTGEAARSRSNRPGSIGLGLYIAREIARSHGGEIDVTSTEREGTAFALRLPRGRGESAVGRVTESRDVLPPTGGARGAAGADVPA